MQINLHLKSKKKGLFLTTGFLLISLLVGIFLYFDYQSFKRKLSVYIIDCDVFSSRMTFLYRGNANMCVFLKNGGVIKYFADRGQGQEAIEYFDSNGVVRWSKNWYAHHMMMTSHDEKILYFLSFEQKMYQDKDTRFDRIQALNLSDGSTLASWNFFDHADEITNEYQALKERKNSLRVPPWVINDEKEFVHANSINLIPRGIPGLENAEIIVNAGKGFELLFTRDLKLLRKIWVDSYWRTNSHDAQVTSKGDLLLYMNWGEAHPGSYIEARSLKTGKVLWNYDRLPKGRLFRARLFGSMQWLEKENHLLVTDMEKGGLFLIIDRNNNQIITEHLHPVLEPMINVPQRFIKIRKLHYNELSQNLKESIDIKQEKGLLSEAYFKILNF